MKLKLRINRAKSQHRSLEAIGVFTRGLLLLLLSSLYTASFAQEFSDWAIVYQKDGDVINKVDFYDHLYGVAVGNDGLVLVTEDGGESWVNRSDANMGDLIHVDLITKDLFFANSADEVFRSVNAGGEWQEILSKKEGVTINSVFQSYVFPSNMLLVCCNDGVLYASLSNGTNFYRQGLGDNYGIGDHILYAQGSYLESVSDTVLQIITSKHGFAESLDDGFSFHLKDDKLQDVSAKNINAHLNFSEAWTGTDIVYLGVNNKAVYGSKTPLLPAGSTTINCCVWSRRITSSQTNWYGWAVGPGGYISESVGGTTGNYKPITSPTTKDLNWIAWGGNYLGADTRGFTEATFCIVGDGVILQKRVNWDPDPVGLPRISNTLHTDVYPNPFDSYFTVETSGWDKNEKINARLYDLNGVLIKDLYSGALPEGSLQLQVVEELPQGVYFMELSSASKKEVKRLVKQ